MAHFLKKSTPWLDQQLGSLFLQLAPLDLCLKVEQDEKRNFEARKDAKRILENRCS